MIMGSLQEMSYKMKADREGEAGVKGAASSIICQKCKVEGRKEGEREGGYGSKTEKQRKEEREKQRR